MASSSITLRKIKQTSYEKKEFWENLIKSNVQLKDIQLKKDFYLQLHDAQDRYQDAIQAQKIKKAPYSTLLGKNKKNQQLKQWQNINKHFEERVNKQMNTLNQWKQNTNYNNFLGAGQTGINYGRTNDRPFIPQQNNQQFQSATNINNQNYFSRQLIVENPSYQIQSGQQQKFIRNPNTLQANNIKKVLINTGGLINYNNINQNSNQLLSSPYENKGKDQFDFLKNFERKM